MANPLRSGQTVKVNEDDVLSLVEMFPGMDRELIETVMTEVNGEIGEAIEKLLEISEKSTVQRLPEQNDLALIACSLLADESNNVVEQQGGGFASTQPPDSVTDKELCLDNSLDDISTFSDIVESEMSKELGNWIEIASGDNGESSNGIFSCAASMDEGKVNTPECAEQHDSIAQSSPEACVSESQTAVMMESSVPSNNLSLNVSVAPSTGPLTTVLSQASPATVVSKTANSGPLQKASEVLKENVAPERRKKEQHQKSWDNFFDSFGIDPLPSADDSLDIDSLIKSVSDTLDAPFGSEIKALQTDNSRVSVGSHKKGGQGGRGRKKKRGTDMKKGPAESAHPQSREAETSKDVPALAQNYKLSPASKEFVPQFLGSLSQADPNLDNSSSMALSLDVSTWTPAVAPRNVGSKQEATRQKNLSEQNHFTKRLDHKKENVVPKDMQESREFGNEPTRLPGGPSVTKAKIFSNLDSGEWKTVVSHPRSGKQVPSQPGVTRTGQVPWRNHSNAKGVNGRQPTPLLQTPISKPVGVTTRVIKNGSGFVPQQSSKGMETLPSLFSPYFPPNDTIKNVKLSAGQIPNAKIPSLMPQEPGQTVKNKLVFHGVKSAVGMARRYFQEQQPVMFILRGLPGSGKSYLANQLLEQSNCMGSAGAVLSSDDFFQQRGGYFFDRHRLDEAHTWNQQRAVKCARNGVSPIIIDNTNTMMWELLPYAVLALEHNYDVQVVEPDTVWRSNLKELTRRNIHGVNREHIKRMKDRYEELTTEKVLQQAGRHFKIKRPNFVKPMTRGKPVHTTRPEKGSSKNKSPTTPLAEVYAEAGADSSSKQIGSCEPFSHLENSLEWLEAKAQRLPTQRRRDRGNSASEEEGKGMITSEFLRQSLKSAILGVINTPNVSTTDSSDHHQSVDDLSLRSGSSSESGEGREDELCSEKILAPVHPLQSDSTTVPSDKFVVSSSNAAISCSSSSVSADNTSVPATITAVASCVPATSADTSNASSGNLTQTSVSTTVPSSTSVPPSVSTPATTLRLDSAKSLVGYSDSDKSDEDTISSNKPAVSVSSLNVGKMTGSESENGETCGDDQKVVRDPPASVMGEQGSSDALGSVNTSDTRWDGDRVRSLSPQELETRSASTSAHASREQSPCVNSDGSTAASTPRKKKQRQRKGRAVPAFLDESVKIQSQSTSWSAFEPQIPKLESLTDVSPSVSLVKREVKSSSCQSEAYYLSAVYRLNSPAFKDFAPADLQESDYKIITSSSQPLSFPGCGQAVEEVAVPRKEGTSDKSTETDEMLEQDTVDLETLQSCFPEYSKKQLEETLAVCHNNMEWVTNHLLDSTALGSEDSDGEEPKVSSDSAGRLANSVGSVLRLATLCSEVLKSLSHVDSDDLEMQVIQAAQTRLQRIEKFNWGRLLSVHSDRAQFGGDDLSIDNFTGTVSADECWEWIPSQDSLEYVQPLMASPVTPVKTPPAFTLDREPWRAKHKVPELRTPVKQPRSPRSASFLRRSDSLSLAPKPGPASAALSPLEEYLQSAGGEARSPVKVATGPNQVVVPADFIQQLELMFGPLQRPEPDQDLPLDDILARKIYNCLKLQANKKSLRSPEEEQLQADEEYARFLQEQEDQKNAEQGQVATGLSIPQGSTPGWTNQRPTWMSSGLEAQTKWESEHRQYHQTHSQHVGSVSSVLHELRGTKGKKLKPTKFRPAVPTTDLNSVWHNSSKGKQPENFQSIMREEREREDLLQEKMSKLHASEGGIDLATKLKRRQLGDMYPMLSSELLDEIFFQNNCSKEDSIEALTLTYGMTPVLVPREQEESHVYSQMRNEVVPEEEEWEPRFSAVEPTASLSYDDLRSEAHLYRRLAKECQDKALRYQSDGMAAAAFFYRQQVKKYKDEEMAANQRAAHVLFEKRHERLDRENLLDLHFYHLEEAKMAVDRAIIMKEEESVANPGKKNSSLYVVTGRGRNSKGGVAKLKPGIIGHLRVRGLRFEDASPGMLKVYLGQRI